MDAEFEDLKAQAEGRKAFRHDGYFERIHERASVDSKSIWQPLPGVPLKFQFYMFRNGQGEPTPLGISREFLIVWPD